MVYAQFTNVTAGWRLHCLEGTMIPMGHLRKRQLVTAQKLDTQQCVPFALLTYVLLLKTLKPLPWKHSKVFSFMSCHLCRRQHVRDMQVFYVVTKFWYSLLPPGDNPIAVNKYYYYYYFHKRAQYQIKGKSEHWDSRWYMRTDGCTWRG